MIHDGDQTPSTTDGTDLGSVVQGTPGPTCTLTVQNVGTKVLTLDWLTVPSPFSLTEPLVGSLVPGQSDEFTLQLDTSSWSVFTVDVLCMYVGA